MAEADRDNSPADPSFPLTDPIDVLADLLGEDGFEIADTRLAAVIIVQRLRDSGFSVVPTQPPAVSGDVSPADMQEVHKLRAEVDRLRDVKRRALQLADERAKEVVGLRRELAAKEKP
jgi:hypothetical protein